MQNSGNEKSTNATGQTFWFALILIVSLFFLWGVANSLNDILIPQFKKAFDLTDFQSSLVQSAFYFGYFCFSIPAAIFMQRLGYRSAVIIGLLLYASGALLFYPAAEAQVYTWFLFALFVIASGLAFLETSANPLIVVMGDPARAAWRLNLAQAFNPFGVLTGITVGKLLILSEVDLSEAERAAMTAVEHAAFRQSELEAVQLPYLVIAAIVVIWALLVFFARFPVIALKPLRNDAEKTSLKDFAKLFQHRSFLFGVAAQFFYVGAQVGIWSFMIRYGQLAQPGETEKSLADYLFWSLVAFTVGRFVATALMHKIDAAKVMFVFALCNIALCTLAVMSVNHLGLLALASTSFFMSLMFPTIFALALRGLGSLTKAGSSFVVMAIIGGAVFAALIGKISDVSAMNYAMLVPAMCFVFIALFSWSQFSKAEQLKQEAP